MSSKDDTVGSVPAKDAVSSAFLDAGWEQRLKKARAKRAKTLSRRGAAKETTPGTTPETEIGLQLSGRMARRALFIFAGSAGFGFGAVLGLGILIWGTQAEDVAQPQIFAYAPSAAVSQPPVSETLDPLRASDPDPTHVAPSRVIAAVLSPALAEPPMVGSSMVDLPEPSALAQKLPAGVQASLAQLAPLREADKQADVFSMSAQIDPKVFIHAPDGVRKTKLDSYATKVEASGVEVAAIGREKFRVSATHLRYYSADAQDTAKALAADLGVPARDFSENALVPGRIELWVAGQPRKRVTSKPAPEPKRTLLSWLRRNAEKR